MIMEISPKLSTAMMKMTNIMTKMYLKEINNRALNDTSV